MPANTKRIIRAMEHVEFASVVHTIELNSPTFSLYFIQAEKTPFTTFKNEIIIAIP